MYAPMGTPIVPFFSAPIGYNVGGGKNFFVATAARGGSDDNEGTDPDFPLLSITEALTKCSARKHDYIWVQDYWANDVGEYPIVIATRDVHIIGLGSGDPRSNRVVVDGVNEPVFQIGDSADGIEIAGFDLGSSGVGDPCIDVASLQYKAHIHHCAFGYSVASQDGIGGAGAGGSDYNHALVDHCLFGDALTRDGIRLGNPVRSQFNNNVFRGVGEIGIRITGSGEGGTIFDNRFFQKLDGDIGSAITLSACEGFMVSGNEAMDSGEDCGNNPFRDQSAATLATIKNAWGINYNGKTATYPTKD